MPEERERERDLDNDQSNGGNSPIDVPSSKIFLTCIKL